jgi:radical SAM superfamily enzyme YgiQ (UPF0313 family)
VLLENLSPRSTVLSPELGRSLTFDREGRLLIYFRHGETFKRSLGSEVHLRFRRGTRQRRRLGTEEGLKIFDEAYMVAGEARPSASLQLGRRLDEEILRWSAVELDAERRRFAAVYKPISILPPDQYLAVVLQATEGCSWNACTFCNFYMDRPFSVKKPEEFERHVAGVKELLGRGLQLRRGIFLADGNALALSNRRLMPLLEIATRELPGRKLYGFIDLYSGERRRPEDWRELAEKGLDRVYVGMETGLDDLLALVNKPGSVVELEAFVAILKTAGLSVCLIVMVGLGGRQYREDHAHATLKALKAMPLTSEDLIYLSPFVEQSGSVYQRHRMEQGLDPMDEAEIDSELERLAGLIRIRGLKASRYDIREFIY